MKYNKLLFIFTLLTSFFVLTSCESDEDAEKHDKQEDRNDPYKFVPGFQDNVEYKLPDNITTADWMASLRDDEKVCKLSIPGTHDALTGMGFYYDLTQYIFNMTAISQVSTLNEQMNHGIRFFDIRPVVSIDTLKHAKVLRCAHGISEIKVTFEESLDMIRNFLKQHNREFIIVKLQNDNGTENQVDWTKMMKMFLKEYKIKYGDIFADWRPDITVGELRGKILFINRKTFDGMYGAHCDWPDEDADLNEIIHPEYEMNRLIVQANEQDDSTVCARMYVQDYYKTTNKTRQEQKIKGLLRIMKEARLCTSNASDNTWILNHCSAYTEVSPRGYVTNAEIMHPEAIRDILEHPKERVGITVIDFACYDNVSVVINGYTPYLSDFLIDKKPMSQSLTNLLIMSNF